MNLYDLLTGVSPAIAFFFLKHAQDGWVGEIGWFVRARIAEVDSETNKQSFIHYDYLQRKFEYFNLNIAL